MGVASKNDDENEIKTKDRRHCLERERDREGENKWTEPSICSTLCYWWSSLSFRASVVDDAYLSELVPHRRRWPDVRRSGWVWATLYHAYHRTNWSREPTSGRKRMGVLSSMARNSYGIILMEYVGDRRIVDDDHFANITTQPTEIFDVIP